MSCQTDRLKKVRTMSRRSNLFDFHERFNKMLGMPINRNELRGVLGGLVLASIFAGAVSNAVALETKVETKVEPKVEAKAEVKVEAKLARTDAFDVIAQDAGLTAGERLKFDEAVSSGKKQLSDWLAGSSGTKLDVLRKEVAAERRTKDKADQTKITENQDQIRTLAEELSLLRKETRAAALAVLSQAQQQKVIEEALFRRLANALDEADLTNSQQAKLRVLSDGGAAEYLKANPLAADPFFRKLIGVQSKLSKEARAEILTEDQREKLKSAAKEADVKDGGADKDAQETTKPAK